MSEWMQAPATNGDVVAGLVSVLLILLIISLLGRHLR